MNDSERKIVLVTRRTRLEELVARYNTVEQARFQAEHLGLDLLVDLEEGRGLFDLGALLMDLQDLLGCDVDVVTAASLRPRVAARVLADAIDL